VTPHIARRAFRKGNVYMQMRDVLGTFFTNDQLLIGNLPIVGPAFTGEWRDATGVQYY
jgi:hypothetical protein